MESSRRDFLKIAAAGPVAAAAGAYGEEAKVDGVSGATQKYREAAGLDKLKGELPKGKIGSMTLSRIIIGNNLIGGWAHSRDLIYVPDLLKAYHTGPKVFETLHMAEAAGIDTMCVINAQADLYRKYRENGGKIQTICQTYPKPDDVTGDIDLAIDNGFTTMYINGAVGDRLTRTNRLDVIAAAIEHIRKQGYPAGIGAHSVQVPMACEAAGIVPDYYVKTFHHENYWSATPRENRREFTVDGHPQPGHNDWHDNMFDLFPDQTQEVMGKVKAPWIAFKVLAAGAIHPRDGFNFAFQNGADFLCVGIFDFQIVEDVNIAIDALAAARERQRPWYG
mgnify:FL=1